jgi:hypothetical protein
VQANLASFYSAIMNGAVSTMMCLAGRKERLWRHRSGDDGVRNSLPHRSFYARWRPN